MIDAKKFIQALELYIEIRDLKAVGLTEEEVVGFIETYCDTWFGLKDISKK